MIEFSGPCQQLADMRLLTSTWPDTWYWSVISRPVCEQTHKSASVLQWGFSEPGSEALACSLEAVTSTSERFRMYWSAQKAKGCCTLAGSVTHHHKYLLFYQTSNKTKFTELMYEQHLFVFFKLFVTFESRSAWSIGDRFKFAAQGSKINSIVTFKQGVATTSYFNHNFDTSAQKPGWLLFWVACFFGNASLK